MIDVKIGVTRQVGIGFAVSSSHSSIHGPGFFGVNEKMSSMLRPSAFFALALKNNWPHTTRKKGSDVVVVKIFAHACRA